MSEDKNRNSEVDPPGSLVESDASPTNRKPYHPPAWEVEEAEVEAQLGCSKDDAGCGAGPIQS